MAPGLHHAVALRELWLKANPIGEQGVSVLAEVFQKNTTLTLLSLLGCISIGDGEAAALVQSLLFNSQKRIQLSEVFKTICERVQGYGKVAHQLEWCADFTKQSVVRLKNKIINCEVLGMLLHV